MHTGAHESTLNVTMGQYFTERASCIVFGAANNKDGWTAHLPENPTERSSNPSNGGSIDFPQYCYVSFTDLDLHYRG